MEANIKRRTLSVSFIVASALIGGLSLPAVAQSSGIMEWSSDALNLRFAYPTDLVKVDPAQAVHDGHLSLLGISGEADPQLAALTRCLRPDLLVQLPAASAPQTAESKPDASGNIQVTTTPAASATILLAELDIDCLTTEQSNSTDLLVKMSELVNKAPNMNAIAEPNWYNVGSQKVHMAASQGQPGNPPGGQLFAMGLATNWNNHLLVWYFSSNSIATLDRITKSTVRFGRAQAAPLYPVTVGNANNPTP